MRPKLSSFTATSPFKVEKRLAFEKNSNGELGRWQVCLGAQRSSIDCHLYLISLASLIKQASYVLER